MHKTKLHRIGKQTLFAGINTRQFSVGFWIDGNSIALDAGIVWISWGWN